MSKGIVQATAGYSRDFQVGFNRGAGLDEWQQLTSVFPALSFPRALCRALEFP